MKITANRIKCIKTGVKASFYGLSLLAGLVFAGVAFSADQPGFASTLSLDYINTNDGLPQTSVRSVLVDLDGFVWAGTEKGLARYDGHRFVNISEINTDIPEDVSLGMQIDSKNRLWTNWYSHSLRILSANRKDVLVIDAAEAIPDDLNTSYFPRLIESGNGDIWFPGIRSLYRMDKNNKVTSTLLKSTIVDVGPVVKGKIIYSTVKGLLLVDPDTSELEYVDVPGNDESRRTIYEGAIVGLENAVIFCHEAGVFRYQLNTKELIQLVSATDLQIMRCKLLGSDLLISSSRIGMESSILTTINIHSGKIIDNPAGLPASLKKRLGIGLYDTFVDKDDHRWVLTGTSLYTSAGAGQEFKAVDWPSKPFGLGSFFAQSQSGAVWVRTDGDGLAKFSHYSQRFQTVTPPTDISLSRRVRSMAVDMDDNVWLSSDSQKLLFWNRKEDSWTDKLPGNTGVIRGIQILPDDSVWVILTDTNKLIGYNPKTGKWEKEHLLNRFSMTMEQSEDGRLLLAIGKDVVLLNPHSGDMQTVNNEPLNGQMRAFEQDQNGNIWVGTHDAGLLRVDSSGEAKYWTRKNSDISSDHIFSLHIDRNQLLWIGTWHGGLLSFNPSTNQFRHFGKDDGLPDSTIFGILEDDAGYLWLSTYDGLVRFDPCVTEGCQPEVIVFVRHDGIQANEFDADSHHKSERGEMFFAGRGGLNAFFPERIGINDQPPIIKFSRIQLNGKPLPGAESEFNAPEIAHLPFGFGDLRLEPAILDFNDPEQNRLQYRDLKVGQAWKDMNQPYLLIHGLNDGSHTFEFRGANNDGVWSLEPASLKLSVAPPLYRHPLAITLYMLLAVLMPISYFRSKQSNFEQVQLRLEHEVANRTRELELANASRERFFANVSHEICSPVHMILLMLENHVDSATDEDREIYKSATGYAAQLMVYLKQLVGEARSHETDSRLYAADIRSIIKRLAMTNKPIATARSISLEIGHLPSDHVAFYASSAISIFSNLLCNALVYTPENGQIKISGEVDKNTYKLAISNTVTNQQAKDIGSYFERGVSGDFNPNYYGGHGLGLSIVASAVETLGGSIHVQLENKHHIVFRIELPLASHNMRRLPDEDDMAFSYEQVLAIKLISDDDQQIPARKKPGNGVSVLVIEDDVLVANLLSQSLSRSFKVYTAGSSQEGIHLLRKHQPDVILCDLFLPDQPGFEVLKVTRANRMSMNVFFVMMTASVSEVDRLKSRELGVDQFVRKPVSAENLRLLIENHINLSKQRYAQRKTERLTRQARAQKLDSKNSFDERFEGALKELYQDPDTTIAVIQTRMSMSYSVLMKNCKKTFGKSPKRLLIEKRISVAKNLLTSSEYRIGLVAELSGFSSHSQFTIVFKKETGQTPAKYRKDSD